MTTKTDRITGSDGKLYDLTYDLVPAKVTPAVLNPATITPAVLVPESWKFVSMAPVAVAAPPTPTPVGSITNFAPANGSNISIDGASARVQNANKSWSLNLIDPYTLQFGVHHLDNWVNGGYSDAVNDGGAERSEVAVLANYASLTQITVSYLLTVLPGPANTAAFMLINQFHETSNNIGPPPFAIYLNGENMDVAYRYLKPGQTSPTAVAAYHDPNPFVRGRAYAMKIQVKFDGTGAAGYLNVWRDGIQIVNYKGPIGYDNSQTYYWKNGVYRAPAVETQTVNFGNLHITSP